MSDYFEPLDPVDLLRVLNAESERVRRYLRELPPSYWDLDSGIVGWTAADVVAHLCNSAQMYVELWQATLAPDREVVPPTGVGLHSAAVRRRAELGDNLVDEYVERDAQLLALFNSIPPGELQSHMTQYGHVRGWIPLWYLPLARLIALVGYERAIRLAREDSPTLPNSSLTYCVRRVGDWLETDGFKPGPRLSVEVRYHFDLTPPVKQMIEVRVRGDRCDVGLPTGPANVIFTTDPETYSLVYLSWLSWKGAIASGRIIVKGNQSLAAQFRDWFGPYLTVVPSA